MNKKTKKGFTITELVIVIAVIAILAAVLIPTFSNVIKNANESVALQEARSEWDNFAPEIATEDNKGSFLIKYEKGTIVKYFLVTDGQFDTEVQKDAKVDGSTVTGVTGFNTATDVAATGSGYDYEYSHKGTVGEEDYEKTSNCTIYKLTVNP